MCKKSDKSGFRGKDYRSVKVTKVSCRSGNIGLIEASRLTGLCIN